MKDTKKDGRPLGGQKGGEKGPPSQVSAFVNVCAFLQIPDPLISALPHQRRLQALEHQEDTLDRA